MLGRFQNKNFLITLNNIPWNRQKSKQNTNLKQTTLRRRSQSETKIMSIRDESSQPETHSDAKSPFRSWKLSKEDYTTIGQGLSFKLVSYNILAQDLLLQHINLYSLCQHMYLKWSCRLAALAKEIVAQKPDIICLQEVQENHLSEIFAAIKGDLPLKLLFKKKTGFKSDGCAILYNENLFELVDHDTVEYFQPGFELLDRHNIALIAKLRCKCQPEFNFLVCTTHLLYNPRREDVRLAQLVVLLAEIDRHSTVKPVGSGELRRIPIILTGDFNFKPDSAPYELLTTGKVCYEELSQKTLAKIGNGRVMVLRTGKKFLSNELGITDNCQHIDCVRSNYECSSSRLFKTNNEPDVPRVDCKSDLDLNLFSTGTLTHDLHLKSAYNHAGPESFGSTFQNEWITVDHLLYSNPLQPSLGSVKWQSTYELPLVENCKRIGCLPNAELGSDHLMLAARFYLIFSDQNKS